MASVIETQSLVDGILRLRRAERVPEVARDIAPVRRDLEGRLGPTLSRSRASRVLGVSQTAFDRWVRAGRIPTVITPTGRVEVPRRFVIELAERIDELDRHGKRRHPLAAALEHRRTTAEGIRGALASLHPAPRPSPVPRGHDTADARALAYHRIVAERPTAALVDEAGERIETLLERRHVDPRYAERWREVLSRSLEEIAEAITRDDQEGRDLRQSTPFAGVLDEHERRHIIETVG